MQQSLPEGNVRVLMPIRIQCSSLVLQIPSKAWCLDTKKQLEIQSQKVFGAVGHVIV